jgi:hypothetical protein
MDSLRLAITAVMISAVDENWMVKIDLSNLQCELSIYIRWLGLVDCGNYWNF